ncbi:HupE/UreJ family protein [Pseudoalteromonas piscicida]|uniref:HupE/UreJ family protein n=1 Tax=Pseudoalteromonas piscicida TaxID=43662 RepID=A0AAD0RLC0_PSEO7|nr:HupE/UreJ family protein [Pseudoalteromonas piscicida]ASD69523.1 hypothetical protein B1L02_21865 [Pseudoalteromonas piscicida]AXR04119.1 HupE/UreJ family protein [Pseudoalteromonas piscicida]
MMQNSRILLLCLTMCLVTFSQQIHAHDARPIVIEINQRAQLADINIKVPASLSADSLPRITIDAQCEGKAESRLRHQSGAFLMSQTVQCEQSIAGRQLNIHFPASNPSLSTLVTVNLENGQQHSQLLAPQQTDWQIPSEENARGIVWQYTQMGALHIFAGWDHLLFVLCLVILAGSLRRIAITATGFTFGHSITLIATALNWIRVPTAFCEILIALSIVFMAVEIAKGDKLLWGYRQPVLVATSFGLIHGFGFAAVLDEIGLPQVELFWGLVSFNVGIELGQLTFIITVVTVFKIASQIPLLQWVKHIPSQTYIYVIGSVAAFWFWQRSISLFYPEV